MSDLPQKNNLFKSILAHRWTKVFLVYIGVFLYATIGFMFFESEARPEIEWGDAIWWTFVTMTTVGYGDLFPETFMGRYFVAIPAMMVGIGIFGFIISELSATLVEIRSKKLRGMSSCTFQDHLIIIHCNRVEMVKELILEFKSDSSCEEAAICIVDNHIDQLPPELQKLNAHFVKGDPSKRDTLERAGVHTAKDAIILSRDPLDPHSDDLNLGVVLMLENLHPGIHSVIEVVQLEKQESLKLAGANSIICNEEFSSNLAVQELQDPGIKDILLSLTSNRVGSQLYLTPVQGQQKTYRDLVIWGLERGSTLMGLVRNGTPILNPKPDLNLEPSDKAIHISEQRPEQFSLT